MFQIKKQIHNLLTVSALNSFQIAGASWVALLADRGFSMLDIGIAESCFHMASFIFEIPSGVISDVFGRKRSMILSQCMFVLSAVFMILSSSLGSVCLAMVLNALGYNFSSGTMEALAYDSLLLAGRESEYMKYSSLELSLYRVGRASATLCAGLALVIGFRKAYFLDMVLGSFCLIRTFSLKEVPIMEKEIKSDNAFSKIRECFMESLDFLKHNLPAEGLMLWNGFVGALATLLLFFLQAQLPLAGLAKEFLGPFLFLIGLGGAAGAWMSGKCSGWTYLHLSVLCVSGVFASLLLGICCYPVLMAIGGFFACFFDDMLQVRSDVRLNEMFPSSQRATLISVSSLCFSLEMMILSPLAGVFFGALGQ